MSQEHHHASPQLPVALFTSYACESDLALRDVLAALGFTLEVLGEDALKTYIDRDEPRIAVISLRDAYFPCGDLLRAMRKTDSLRTIALGDKHESTMHTRALLMGADAYLTHDFPIDELSQQLRALTMDLQGGTHGEAQGTWRLTENKACLITPHGRRIDLSPSERVVLYILMSVSCLPIRYNVLLDSLSSAGLPCDISRLHRLIFRLRQKILEQWPANSPLTSLAKETVAFSP